MVAEKKFFFLKCITQFYKQKLLSSIYNKGKKLERANYVTTNKVFIKFAGNNFTQKVASSKWSMKLKKQFHT